MKGRRARADRPHYPTSEQILIKLFPGTLQMLGVLLFFLSKMLHNFLFAADSGLHSAGHDNAK
jgi:hypothetical protein